MTTIGRSPRTDGLLRVGRHRTALSACCAGVAVAAAMGIAAIGVTGAAAMSSSGLRDRCPTAHSVTQSATIIVYIAGYGAFVEACYKPTGHRLLLGDTDMFFPVAAGTRYIAFFSHPGVFDPTAPPTPTSGYVLSVYDMRTGRRLRATDLFPTTNVYVSGRGVAAYFDGTADHGTLSVFDHHGTRVVVGGNIRRASIRFVGRKLEWAAGRVQSSAETYP
jgi:hypothetical protein